MKTMLLERVLIPLDGTAAAESVVPLLEPILCRSGSEVFLVRTVGPAEELREADEYLQGIAGRFLDEGLCAHTMVGKGSAPEIIERLATGEDVTLIAMSVPPEGLGPVMERLIRVSAKPVLALRPPYRPALSRKGRRTILAPLDGSEASRRSLPLALELAGILDARVILMRVIVRDDEEIEALQDLHDVARRLAEQGLTAEIRSDGPADQLGPVTAEIMNRSPVPVLAVHVRGA